MHTTKNVNEAFSLTSTLCNKWKFEFLRINNNSNILHRKYARFVSSQQIIVLTKLLNSRFSIRFSYLLKLPLCITHCAQPQQLQSCMLQVTSYHLLPWHLISHLLTSFSPICEHTIIDLSCKDIVKACFCILTAIHVYYILAAINLNTWNLRYMRFPITHASIRFY